MIGTIRKHQTWLWVIIITLTVGSFVVLGPMNTKVGNISDMLFGRKQTQFGMLAGRPISAEQWGHARNEVMLEAFLKNQQWPNPNALEVTRQTYYRLFLIQKQKDLGVEVSTQAAATYARHMLGPGSMDEFVEKVLKPVGLDESDFDRFLRNSLGIEQLAMMSGVSGRLVTPQEAETMYKLEHQDLEAYLVHFTATNYLDSVKVTPEIIGQFYTNQLANYRLPERVQVAYVKFNVTNYFPEVAAAMTNLNELVEANMQRLGTNVSRVAATPAAARLKIHDELLRQHALVLAHKAAGQFAETLDRILPHSLDSLAQLAASNHLTVQTTAAFDREFGPQEMLPNTNFVARAFSLAPDELFAGPIVAEDGIYEIGFKQRYPSETPALAQIQERVTEDYRFGGAVQLAQQAALKFDNSLTNGLAAGKTFNALCALSGVKYDTLPPFSLSTGSLPIEVEDKVNFNLLKQVAFSTPPGKASPVAGARDGGFIVYVARQLPIDDAKMKTELPGFLAYLRAMRQNEAFTRWFNLQMNQDREFVQTITQATEQSQMKGSTARRPPS